VPDAPIALDEGCELRIDGWLQPSPGFYDLAWRVEGRLLGAPLSPTGRRRCVARVDIEIDAWSRDATRVQLRPSARHPERWSARRLERYFTLAHEAVDEAARSLSRAARGPAVPRSYELVGARSG
jgi:hypothetical protein